MLRTIVPAQVHVPTPGAWPWAGNALFQPAAPVRAHGSLEQTIALFEPISLAQMTRFALLDRTETKYLFPESLLASVLASLTGSYRVLAAAGRALSRYRTIYFDTADLAMYRRHHAGAANRYKVRAREYVDSHATFLEVKHKSAGQRTVKRRIATRQLVTELDPPAADFLADACPYAAEELVPSLWSQYTRITLVSTQRLERVTLDLGLTYGTDKQRADLPGIVVAEVKYVGARHESAFAAVMHERHLRSTSFSKYCMGVSLLYPAVKHNRFKAKQRLVARVQGESNERG